MECFGIEIGLHIRSRIEEGVKDSGTGLCLFLVCVKWVCALCRKMCCGVLD